MGVARGIPDDELVAFLQWALPRMGLRWRGFKNFRGTIKKRLARRMAEIGLASLSEYRARLESDPGEWSALDPMCRITISRLYRDGAVMDFLRREILPAAAERARAAGRAVRVWSAGCASGEEPYTIALVWALDVARAHPDVAIEIVATDADAHLVDRARLATFAPGSVRELPDELVREGLVQTGADLVVRADVRAAVALRVEDLRDRMPDGPFDVVLCRNVAFTYFDEPVQRAVGERLARRLATGGVLVIGGHEALPAALERDLERLAPAVFALRSSRAG